MAVLLVVEFPSAGPFGAEAATAYDALARDIAEQEGLIWKVWTEAPERNVAGGVYLFTGQATADAYVEMHTRRLAGFGITDVSVTSYEVNEDLSAIDHATLER
ncbi:monooxygenase [Corynebacterium maris DSM 45190]|uniref:Monooxygenase n=1 Tax=Corynebacterium maris DSM 45190 TaxID=1224163 RepID=S5SR49_9CORY|nr:monooxygenase [Corynebacterium maris]AGS33554.1 monooxygenase [Corynebacterium maris DSM 45190]